jgi:hypothetical protein
MSALRPLPGAGIDALAVDGRALSQPYHSWMQSTQGAMRRVSAITESAANPTAADISPGDARLWKNTTLGQVRLWVNDAGTLRSVQLT